MATVGEVAQPVKRKPGRNKGYKNQAKDRSITKKQIGADVENVNVNVQDETALSRKEVTLIASNIAKEFEMPETHKHTMAYKESAEWPQDCNDEMNAINELNNSRVVDTQENWKHRYTP